MSHPPQGIANAVADRYRIEREIGEGGMARVYLAHDLRHERDVAIKVLHPELAAALGGERFLAEIKTTAKLQHPHILPLLDSGVADGVLYYVMPFVAGETLRARLEREHLLPIDDALRIGREVADALEHAHKLGIIHRDIKPENILLQDGHALVADFGIALAVQQAGGARMTQTGLSLGTPQYMSPEQAMGERTIDARSDLYSLAAVIYEMLVGDPPFTGSTVQGIVAKVMTERPARIVTQRDRVPASVEAAVLRALEKLPADRWASVREFVEALKESSATHAAAALVPAHGSFANRRRRSTRALAGVGLLAAGTVVGWMTNRSRAEPDDGAPLVTSILPPSGGNFSEQQAIALSADGRKLAFVFAAPDGSHNLWIRELDKLDPTPLPGTTGADIPFWSPDGRSLGFFSGGYLNIIDEKGNIRRVCPAPTPSGGSWDASGLIVFSDNTGVSSVSASGGSCRRVIERGTGPVVRGVLFPDGKHILSSRGQFSDLVLTDLDGRSIATVPIHVQWFSVAAPDYLVFSNQADIRSLDVQRLDLKSGKLVGSPVRLVNGVRSRSGVHTFSLSRDALAYLPGRADRAYLMYDAKGLHDTLRAEGFWTVSARPRAAGSPLVALGGGPNGIWLLDLESQRTTKVTVQGTDAPQDVGAPGGVNPVFSPDGSHLAYGTIAGQCSIRDYALDRGVDRLVARGTFISGNRCLSPLDWAMDGKQLLVRDDTTLVIMSLDGTVTSRITRPGTVWEGHFAPDSRRVTFSSDETGRAEVYVQTLPDGTPSRLSNDGGRWPAFTSDGKHVVYMSPEGTIYEVTVNGTSSVGKPRAILSVATWRRSTFDDRGIGFAMVGDEERFLIRQSPSGLAVAYLQHWSKLLPH